MQLDSGVAHSPKGKTLSTKSLGTQTDVHCNLNVQLIPACHLWWLLSFPLHIGLGNIDIWAGQFVVGDCPVPSRMFTAFLASNH